MFKMQTDNNVNLSQGKEAYQLNMYPQRTCYTGIS